MIFSITFNLSKSSAVSFIRSAASLALEASFQRILANPSGERTAYIPFSSIHTSSATARANAPPLPPSPINILMIGVFNLAISNKFLAIASPSPRSSAPSPQ